MTESIHEQIAFASDHLSDYFRNEVELRGSVMYGALATMEGLNAVYALVVSYSHFCSGRDCVGLWVAETGSLSRCYRCSAMKHAIAAVQTQHPEREQIPADKDK